MTDRTWGQNGSLFTAGAAKYQSRLKKIKKKLGCRTQPL